MVNKQFWLDILIVTGISWVPLWFLKLIGSCIFPSEVDKLEEANKFRVDNLVDDKIRREEAEKNAKEKLAFIDYPSSLTTKNLFTKSKVDPEYKLMDTIGRKANILNKDNELTCKLIDNKDLITNIYNINIEEDED